MERQELSKLIDNLVKQVLNELHEEGFSALPKAKALVVVPETVFSLHKYEQYFLDTYKNLNFTLACFFESALYKGKSKDIAYVTLDEQGQIEISDRIDDFDKLFVIVNDMSAIDDILGDGCCSFVKGLIGYCNMQEQSISLVTSFKNTLKLNTAIKSRGVKLKNNRMDIINIGKDKTKLEYDPDMLTEKKVITEKEIEQAYDYGAHTIELDKKQLVTPLAKDKARDYGIKIAY